jgi:hypothetical protein
MLLVRAAFLVLPPKSAESARSPIKHVSRTFNGWIMGVIFFLENVHVLISNILPQSIDCVFTSSNTVCNIRCIANGLVIMQIHHSSCVSNIVLLKVQIAYSLGMAQVFKLNGIRG